ncbi:MAG TPA: hypothetical protein VHP83_14075 [Aggregatilineaceae bacterium]|nr:hypothetical protein [Aggregatilineaceae bacterium]
MKHLLVRLAVVVLLAATVFGVAPRASAQSEAYVEFYGAEWYYPSCDPVSGNYVVFYVDYNIPAGYILHQEVSYTSALYGNFYDSMDTVSSGMSGIGSSGSAPVPPDGKTLYKAVVYAPNGLELSSTSAEADCVTGSVFNPYGDVYGINEPPASQRVLGTVLVDTPVYSEASPTAALKPVLKAGQTWFIVGQVTGTDGDLWYKVFVGGANYGYVPASAIAPQGPVPGAK